ncbi:hypothetical protein HYH03_001563 [Edaphochlamys debaryana]|uniref:Calmodulin n=1 Tax=Edaphochlamys debaryana TaxID=47281 RepID=A0A836C529_9CHLO|nr:hypothetical protein HYH03_001563 [Edaphochlamys debaryana]|eukprot:KAG2500801.1 hypothetical protein HYH03_001563 [Edaphochlamys debaryana]
MATLGKGSTLLAAFHNSLERIKTIKRVCRALSKKPQLRTSIEVGYVMSETEKLALLTRDGPGVHRDLCHVARVVSLKEMDSWKLPPQWAPFMGAPSAEAGTASGGARPNLVYVFVLQGKAQLRTRSKEPFALRLNASRQRAREQEEEAEEGEAEGGGLEGVTEAEMMALFQSIDVDGSGAIDVSELQTALEMMGIHKSEDEVTEMMEGVDEDGSGELEFAEFRAILRKAIRGTGGAPVEWREAGGLWACELGPGSSVGEAALLDPSPQPQDATLLALDATDLLVLERTDYERILENGFDGELKAKMALLRSTPVLGEALRRTDLRLLAHAMARRTVPMNSTLYEQGAPPASLDLIVEGHCKVTDSGFSSGLTGSGAGGGGGPPSLQQLQSALEEGGGRGWGPPAVLRRGSPHFRGAGRTKKLELAVLGPGDMCSEASVLGSEKHPHSAVVTTSGGITLLSLGVRDLRRLVHPADLATLREHFERRYANRSNRLAVAASVANMAATELGRLRGNGRGGGGGSGGGTGNGDGEWEDAPPSPRMTGSGGGLYGGGMGGGSFSAGPGPGPGLGLTGEPGPMGDFDVSRPSTPAAVALDRLAAMLRTKSRTGGATSASGSFTCGSPRDGTGSPRDGTAAASFRARNGLSVDPSGPGGPTASGGSFSGGGPVSRSMSGTGSGFFGGFGQQTPPPTAPSPLGTPRSGLGPTGPGLRSGPSLSGPGMLGATWSSAGAAGASAAGGGAGTGAGERVLAALDDGAPMASPRGGRSELLSYMLANTAPGAVDEDLGSPRRARGSAPSYAPALPAALASPGASFSGRALQPGALAAALATPLSAPSSLGPWANGADAFATAPTTATATTTNTGSDLSSQPPSRGGIFTPPGGSLYTPPSTAPAGAGRDGREGGAGGAAGGGAGGSGGVGGGGGGAGGSVLVGPSLGQILESLESPTVASRTGGRVGDVNPMCGVEAAAGAGGGGAGGGGGGSGAELGGFSSERLTASQLVVDDLDAANVPQSLGRSVPFSAYASSPAAAAAATRASVAAQAGTPPRHPHPPAAPPAGSGAAAVAAARGRPHRGASFNLGNASIASAMPPAPVSADGVLPAPAAAAGSGDGLTSRSSGAWPLQGGPSAGSLQPQASSASSAPSTDLVVQAVAVAVPASQPTAVEALEYTTAAAEVSGWFPAPKGQTALDPAGVAPRPAKWGLARYPKALAEGLAVLDESEAQYNAAQAAATAAVQAAAAALSLAAETNGSPAAPRVTMHAAEDRHGGGHVTLAMAHLNHHTHVDQPPASAHLPALNFSHQLPLPLPLPPQQPPPALPHRNSRSLDAHATPPMSPGAPPPPPASYGAAAFGYSAYGTAEDGDGTLDDDWDAPMFMSSAHHDVTPNGGVTSSNHHVMLNRSSGSTLPAEPSLAPSPSAVAAPVPKLSLSKLRSSNLGDGGGGSATAAVAASGGASGGPAASPKGPSGRTMVGSVKALLKGWNTARNGGSGGPADGGGAGVTAPPANSGAATARAAAGSGGGAASPRMPSPGPTAAQAAAAVAGWSREAVATALVASQGDKSRLAAIYSNMLRHGEGRVKAGLEASLAQQRKEAERGCQGLGRAQSTSALTPTPRQPAWSAAAASAWASSRTAGGILGAASMAGEQSALSAAIAAAAAVGEPSWQASGGLSGSTSAGGSGGGASPRFYDRAASQPLTQRSGLSGGGGGAGNATNRSMYSSAGYSTGGGYGAASSAAAAAALLGPAVQLAYNESQIAALQAALAEAAAGGGSAARRRAMAAATAINQGQGFGQPPSPGRAGHAAARNGSPRLMRR